MIILTRIICFAEKVHEKMNYSDDNENAR